MFHGAFQAGQAYTCCIRSFPIRRVPSATRGNTTDDAIQFSQDLERFGVVHRAFGVEEAVGVASNDPFCLCEADIRAEPMRTTDIRKAICRLVSVDACIALGEQSDLQEFGAVECAVRHEGAVGIARDRSQVREQADARRLRRSERRITVARGGIGVVQCVGIGRSQDACEEKETDEECADGVHSGWSIRVWRRTTEHSLEKKPEILCNVWRGYPYGRSSLRKPLQDKYTPLRDPVVQWIERPSPKG